MQPDVAHLRAFRCGAYVFLPEDVRSNNLSPRSKLMTFIGLVEENKGYIFMRSPNNIVFTAIRALFDKTLFSKCPNICHLGYTPVCLPADDLQDEHNGPLDDENNNYGGGNVRDSPPTPPPRHMPLPPTGRAPLVPPEPQQTLPPYCSHSPSVAVQIAPYTCQERHHKMTVPCIWLTLSLMALSDKFTHCLDNLPLKLHLDILLDKFLYLQDILILLDIGG
jgi:hypothetical protein